MTVFPISRLTTAALSFALTAAAAAAAPTGHIDHSPDRSPTRHAPAAPAATPLHDLTLPRVTAAMPRSAVVAALRAQLEAAAKPSADAPAAARSANRDDADATPTAAPQSSATAARAAKRGAVDGAPAFAAASATTVAVSPQDVVNALLRGEDARAAIASLRSAQPSPDLSKAQTDESASGGFVRAREALRGVLAGLHKRGDDNGTARSRLIAASDASQAQALLLDLRLEQQQAALRDKPLPATATAQVTARTQRLRDHLRAVAAAASTLRSTLNAQSDATPIDAAVTAELDALLATDADDAPVYGANPLPVHRPRLPAREPAMTPAIVPSYAIADADVEPQPADYADSADAALSPAILAHAASLGHDYTRIVDFVRSTVRTRWYAGARQDADATLRSLSGNDVDQASLLIALLRASRAPARYVHGVVEVNLDDLAASLGVRGDKVGLALAAAGIAQRPVVRGGRIAAYAIEHTFVSAHLPMSNYRGSSADRSGRSWIALAPALKPHRFVAASGAFARTQFDANTFIDGHLQQPRNESPLQRLRDQIASALGVQSPPLSYDAMLAQHAVDAPPLELLPASLPMPVLAVTGEFAQLPEQLRQQLHLVVRSGEASDAPIALETRIGVAQLAGRRISLAWQPASVDDGAIVDAHGGMSRTPPYLYRVRPMLLVAGQAERAGTAPIDTATRHRVELTFEGPGGSAGFAQTLIAGGQSALAIDVSDSAAVPDHASALPGDSEQRGARLLANLGARYLATWNGDDDELAALAGVGVVRPFPSAALVISQYRVDRLDGLATAMRWRGVALDAAMRPAEAFAAVATNAAESDWTALSALQGSALEHRVFEQQWSVASISADKGLALARSQGRTVLTLNATSGSGGVHQPPAVVAAIDHWLARGYVVEVPAEPLTQDAWTGAVWRVRSLSTGESGYFIAGQLAGGSTTLPPELWYLQDLVAVLGDPSALPPNENPLAAAILTLDRTTQHQSGTADQTLPEPLRALALDTDGRPVRNAVVTFRVTASDSQLLDAQGHEAASVSVTTDARGLAASPLKLARRQGTTGHYVLPDPDTQQLQWVGHATVEVSVTTATGELHSGEAFVADIGPATPQQLHVDYPDTQAARYFRIGYDSVRATVTDAFDNPVSNVPVIARVDTDFSQSECTGTTRFGPLIGAALFDKRGEGGCPTDDFRLTGHACTRTSPLPMTTGADGIVFFVTAPSHPRTQYTVHVSAVGHEENASLQTHPLNSATGCNSFISLFHQMDNPVNAAGQSAYAAKPGEIIAAPYTFQALVAMVNDLSNVDGPPWSWQPLSGGRIGIVDPLQHGSLDSWREVAPGQYAFYLRAGAVPGDIRGRLSLTGDLPPGAGSFGFTTYDLAARGVYSEDTDDYSYGWSIDLNPPRLEPDRIALTPFNTTQADLVLRSDYYPPQWQPSVNAVYLMRNGEDVEGCSFLDRNYGEACTIRRGLAIDPAAQYTATTVLHNGLVRLESEPTEVHFNAGIIAGYGLLPTDATQTPRPASNGSPQDETELIGLLRGQFPTNLSVSQDVDTATGYVCETPTRLGYLLSQPARVDIRFRLLDRDGNPTDRELWPQPEQQLDAGPHFLEIPAARLPIGSYVYELTAISAAGVQDQRSGVISSSRSRHDVVPLAHSFVQGIDLYSGSAVLPQPDIVLGGRGPGLSLVRTYSSHAGDRRGFFGRGWSADLDMQVISNACGSHTVLGGAGQGMRFVPDGIDPDGAQRYRPLHGYHGSLVRHGNLFDFIARNGTRYHFAEPDPDGPRLSYVEDTNGNRVTYTWQRDADTPRVESITDAAGRTITLTYAIRTVSRPVGDIDILDSYTLVTSASVPEELRIDYRYDDTGNLVEARRSDRTNLGTQRTEYDYADYDGLYYVQPDGEMAYARFGFRLTAVRDAIDGSVRRYRYAADGATPTPYWTGVQTAERTYYYPELRVTEVTLPDTASTTFAYDEDVSGALRGLLAEPVTIVTDARNHPTTTRMNRYGAATAVTDPVGTTLTTWDTVHLQPATRTDALGGITTFTYDDHGNTTSEVLVTPHGERRQSWTYHPTSAFDTPHITDRVATATDPRSHVTRHEYDRRGNATATTRGGITTTDGYAANGDRTSRIDGNSKTWLIRYDAYGYPREAQSPLGHIVTTVYDQRGRLRAQIDANNRDTDWFHDARDRVTLVLHPTAADGTYATERFAYDDTTRTITHTDARTIATVRTFDPLQRLITERLGPLARSREYDPNGNLIEQTDYAGHATTFDYDAANRLLTRNEGVGGDEVRTSVFTHDALGHVLSEHVGAGAEQRVTEYRYAHPTYQRTHVRRQLDAEWVEESTQYDATGNPEVLTDALGRTTTRVFDQRDRVVSETAPLGKVTTLTYDGRDQLRTEVRTNTPGSGTQTRERRYDEDGRLVTEIDATNVARTLGYDNGTNVLVRRDGRGHATHYRYDERDNLVEERGPETGQLTTYDYDGNKNRTLERWANGRDIVRTYDDENRLLVTTDNLGPVETRSYWPDGLLKSMSDADGRTTYQFHDSLHRLTREDLPGDMARSRSFTHTIHGEVLTQTDPRSHVTRHAYDTLGRRISTTFPAVDGATAGTTTDYDDVGNMLEQTNTRGQATTFVYNDLNQKTEQIDPIECVDDGPITPKSAAADATVATTAARAPSSESHGFIASLVIATKRFVLALSAAITPVTASAHSATVTPVHVSARAEQTSVLPPAQRTAIPQANTSARATAATPSQVPAVASAATAADRTALAASPSSDTAATRKASTAACSQSWTYDLQGNVLTHTDRRSITTTNRYDAENRLASQDRAGLTIQSLTRDAQGNVVTQRDALQRETTFTYDKANRKLSEHRSGLASEAWTYTPLSDIATHTDADARTTTYTYTVRRFLDTESLAGETTRYTLDGVGHRLTRERPKGQPTTWTYTYDAAGNLRTVTDPLDHTTTFDHDANDNRVSILDANDHETTFAYDERNRLRGKTYPGGAQWQWRYDGDNNRIRSEAPNGRVAETIFDALNRPTLTNYLGAPASEVQSTAWTYDGNSNIRTIVEATSTGPRNETRDYDDFDRLTHALDSDNRTVSYAYDDVGNRTHLIDHDGKDTVWTYNALNHNTRVFVPGIGTTVHTYTPAGLPDTLTRPDGALTDYAYFATGRLQTVRHAKNGTTLARYDYVYDPNGNRTEQREVNGAVSNDTTQTTIYRYDDADRLSEVEEPNRTSTYTLDDVGNRTVEHVADTGTTTSGSGTISHSTLVYNDRDQLTSRTDPIANVSLTQTWDNNGNLATQTVNGAAPRVYTYDARDRLIALSNPSAPNGQTSLTFAYHSNGLRREKTTASSTTRYQYDDQSLLAETNAIGNTLRQFHYSATQLIAQTQAGTTPTYRHYLLDALRSPIALLDMAGAVTARTSYDAFGEIRAQQGTSGALTTPNREAANADLASTDNQPIGFTGYLKDPESGLYYAKARYYDPATARFTTEDPEAGKDLEPPSLHRYLYAYANPTAYYDATGRQAEILGMQSATAQLDLDPEIYKARQINTAGDFKAAWEFARDTVTSTFALATTMLRAQAEADLREESRPASDALRAGLDNSWEAITDRPAERYFSYRDSIEQKAKAYELANDPVNARKERTKLNIETASAFLGAYGVTRSIARNGARAIAGANARSGTAGSAIGIEAADGTVALVDSSPASGQYLFRGTSEGYPGNPGLQRFEITPASTDPVVATIFATESESYGKGVVHLASPDDLAGVELHGGNVLAGKEAEVGVGLKPLDFAKKASTTISADTARGILGEMGIHLPSRIPKSKFEAALEGTPRLDAKKTEDFIKQAREAARKSNGN